MKKRQGLKVISINIEKDKHFNRLIPFLQEQKPDVVLMQEVFEKDISFLENPTGMLGSFAVLSSNRGINNSKFGLLNLVSIKNVKSYSIYYRGNESEPPEISSGEAANMARAILVSEFIKDERHFCVVNTHFTWTPDGHPSEKQNIDLEIMLQQLSRIPEFILCGDFNAPRGRLIFDKISDIYKDNIPSFVTTTIDKAFHKAGDLQLVVDGLFTTPKYHVDFLKIVPGLSDHCAILAEISTN